MSAFPEALRGMLAHLGTNIAGLDRLQYKVGVDVSQIIWDGGMSKVNREIRRADAAESEAAIAVELYAVRERVQSVFFGILLMDQQITLMESTIHLLDSNRTQLEAMVRDGVAMQCDVDMVEAQILTMRQKLTDARNAADTYRQILGLYIAEEIGERSPVCPEAEMPETAASNRPELTLFDRKLQTNLARERTVDASLMPHVGFFAQAYYGYPGLNMYESMMNRKLSFNVLAGVKVVWNIDSFYTRRNTRNRLGLASDMVRNEREVFLFNSGLQIRQEMGRIKSLREVVKDDDRIVDLRRSVRAAAESQLQNGIIDATALLTKITDENQALMTRSLHEIQLLQEIYNLKYILNR